jgi:segregation and condensation protein B
LSRPTEPPHHSEDEQALALLFDLHEQQRLCALIEAAVFAAPEPVTARQLARALEEAEEHIELLLDQIIAEHEKPEHGIFLRKTGAGYQMSTKPEHHAALQEVLRGLRPRSPLSLPALETLAIVAYKQPISAPEIQAIRRVEGAGVLQTLLKRKLIAPACRKKDAGNALLYRTTALFLKDFGLKDLDDLPDLQEFRESVHSFHERQPSE